VTVSLPEAAAIDADGNPNAASNTLAANSSGAGTGSIISNGRLNTVVSQYPSSLGDSTYYLEPTTLVVFEQQPGGAAVNTGKAPGTWLWSTLTRGFAYSPNGGAGGTGDGAFVAYTPRDPFNQRPRAVAQFAADNKTTRGSQTLRMDVFMDDNSASNPLTFLVELYAWNSGQTGPKLSLGGGAANSATYNSTILGNAQTLLKTQVAATSVADAAWQTATLSTVDLGNGYDFYAWRIGVMGQTTGDTFAFDNVGLVGDIPTYSQWIADFGLDEAARDFNDDPDHDQLANGLEAWFGTHPGEFGSGLILLAADGQVATFSHPRNENPPGDLSGSYQWSPNLIDWYAGDGVDGPPGGPVLTIGASPAGSATTVTATSSAPAGRVFVRAAVALTPGP
jgi:hypothetical protein